MQKIIPFLWFDGKAEEAMNFYTALFKNSQVKDVMRYGDAGPGPKGTIMSVTFEIEGQEFIALNGGPIFTFSPAISFFVHCETQDEVDHYWTRLSEGGRNPAMRMAHGQIRRDLADRPDDPSYAVGGQEPREIQIRHASHDEHDKVRYQASDRGLRTQLTVRSPSLSRHGR